MIFSQRTFSEMQLVDIDRNVVTFGLNQCEQIGLLLQGLNSNFSLKSCPKYLETFWAILKNTTC